VSIFHPEITLDMFSGEYIPPRYHAGYVLWWVYLWKCENSPYFSKVYVMHTKIMTVYREIKMRNKLMFDWCYACETDYVIFNQCYQSILWSDLFYYTDSNMEIQFIWYICR
jgi:hypothetical protein